ncbi:hypothetical protein TNCV_4203881 [Trichonephila clavipes]|nr:hypothetical protein TNCV_4203881 [Trichonephila clavipes]
MDLVILNHSQVMRTTPELASPSPIATTPHQREDVGALSRFNMHHSPKRWIFSGTRFEFMTRLLRVRYLDH